MNKFEPRQIKQTLTRICAVGCVLLFCVSACTVIRITPPIALNKTLIEIPEEELLDINIGIFSPLEEETDLEDTNINLDNLRQTEGYYVSILLSNTLKDSNNWGVVRVNPHDPRGSDIIINGEVLQSDGQTMRLHVKVHDSMERVWLEKVYVQVLDDDYYDFSRTIQEDPFQDLYDKIANDVVAYKTNRVNRNEILSIRQVSQLQFASYFSPEVYNPYLNRNSRGVIELTRLPAINDPNFSRIQSIRARNDSYLDLLQSQYLVLIAKINDPYYEFRRRSYLMTKRINEQLMAGPEYVINREINPDGVMASAGVTPAGRETVASSALANRRKKSNSLNRGEKAAIYSRILALMGRSIELELETQIIEFEDRSVVLSGSVEDQYKQWQEVLDEMYRIESGQ